MKEVPPEVHIIIDRHSWTLTQTTLVGEPYNVYPAHPDREHANWTVGPIEVARILERLGIRVTVTVERSV